MNLNQTKIGVLDDMQLLTYDYREQKETQHRVDTTQVWLLSSLLDGAQHFDIDTLWIAPGSHISQHAKDILRFERSEEFVIRASKKSDGTPRFLLMYRKAGNTKSVKLAFPQWDDRWPWQHPIDSETLFRSVLYLQDALQFEIAWSPGHTGQELILSLDKKRGWLTNIEIPDVMKSGRNLAKDMKFFRPLTKEEARPGMYLHLFDGINKYLGACTSANIGEGNPTHIVQKDEQLGVDFHARFPGVWNVDGWGWIWTPELEYRFACLEDNGPVRPQITEAWIWTQDEKGKPRYHQALRSFGENMWLGRCKIKSINSEARALAYEAFKRVYSQGLGWCAHPSEQGDNKLFRPDLWSQVVATAYRSMGFKIRHLAKKGQSVCYVNTDAIGLISEGESIEQYRKTVLDREGLLGGFKYVGSVPITLDLAHVFETKSDRGQADFKKVQAAIDEALKGAKEMLV